MGMNKQELYEWEIKERNNDYYNYVYFLVEGDKIWQKSSDRKFTIEEVGQDFFLDAIAMGKAEAREEWKNLAEAGKFELIKETR